MKKIATGTAYKVEKNIPIERKVKDRIRFPFASMELGDSFFIPSKDQNPLSALSSIFSAVNSYNRNHKTTLKVTTRKTEEGVRVWRIN